jgi:hypothetical protein
MFDPRHFMSSLRWHAVTQLMRHCSRSRRAAGSIHLGALEFFIGIILPAALWPWIDSASNSHEYQEYFLRPALRAVPVVLKFGSLSLLERSRSVQPCTGIALPLYFDVWVILSYRLH